MKITKNMLKEMVREAVQKMLDEQYDRGDHDWARSIDAGDLFDKIKQAKMPSLVKQKMDQVISAIEKKEGLRLALSAPQNRKKIEAALAGKKFDMLANALEKAVVGSSSANPN